jgi:hypothetical protein
LITSNQADVLIHAAKSKAVEIGIAVTVVVMDTGGNLKALSRMDGAWLGSIDVAMKKAEDFEVARAGVAALAALFRSQFNRNQREPWKRPGR